MNNAIIISINIIIYCCLTINMGRGSGQINAGLARSDRPGSVESKVVVKSPLVEVVVVVVSIRVRRRYIVTIRHQVNVG